MKKLELKLENWVESIENEHWQYGAVIISLLILIPLDFIRHVFSYKMYGK